MADYDLYYWPLPFRGQFIRAILAFAGKTWTEHDSDDISALMEQEPGEQPAPFMGPPVLIETGTGFAVSQMPAIALYLGDTLALIPQDPRQRAFTAKIVNDANDVIDELTLDGGREMWTADKWQDFVPRLQRWMLIFEATASRNGVDSDGGFLLRTPDPGVADIVTSTLWSTMGERFPSIAKLLEDTAPRTAALTRRLQALPALAELARTSRERYGDSYCGGQIEASLRQVLDA